jgi:hypothetical protein
MVGIALLQESTESRAVRRFFAEGQRFAPDSIQVIGTIGSSLREISGLGVSRTYRGVLWAHNDSGDGPVVYALRMDGALIRRFRLPGASSWDWEAMEVGPCPVSADADSTAGSCIYLGEVGDNERRREVLSVHVVREPDPNAEGELPLAHRTLTYRYADEPRDVEALAVSPAGRLTLISKGRSPEIVVYQVEADRLAESLDGDPIELSPSDTLPFAADWTLGRTVTGAAYSPSGERLVVRTYTEIYFFDVGDEGRLTQDGEACFLGADEPQGEAVDFLDERTLITASESLETRPGLLRRLRCR